MDDNVIRFPKGPCGLVRLSDLPEPEPVIPWYAGYPEFRHKMQLASGMLSVGFTRSATPSTSTTRYALTPLAQPLEKTRGRESTRPG